MIYDTGNYNQGKICIIFPDITYFDMCEKIVDAKINLMHVFNHLWRAITNLVSGYTHISHVAILKEFYLK
jgi:hypothetical protein